ncbi:hypothetical protein VULLAG_LOCUS19530 [Vulpes lagopus]
MVLREYLKLDSKAGFITNSDVEEVCSVIHSSYGCYCLNFCSHGTRI